MGKRVSKEYLTVSIVTIAMIITTATTTTIVKMTEMRALLSETFLVGISVVVVLVVINARNKMADLSPAEAKKSALNVSFVLVADVGDEDDFGSKVVLFGFDEEPGTTMGTGVADKNDFGFLFSAFKFLVVSLHRRTPSQVLDV